MRCYRKTEHGKGVLSFCQAQLILFFFFFFFLFFFLFFFFCRYPCFWYSSSSSSCPYLSRFPVLRLTLSARLRPSPLPFEAGPRFDIAAAESSRSTFASVVGDGDGGSAATGCDHLQRPKRLGDDGRC